MIDPLSIGVFIVLPLAIAVLILAFAAVLLYKRISGASKYNANNPLYDEEQNIEDPFLYQQSTRKIVNVNEKTELQEITPENKSYTFKQFWKDLKNEIRKTITFEGEAKTKLKNQLLMAINEDGSTKQDDPIHIPGGKTINKDISGSMYVLGKNESGHSLIFNPELLPNQYIQKPFTRPNNERTNDSEIVVKSAETRYQPPI